MLTANEIRNTTFDKVMRGYKPEDVEAFLSEVADDYEALENSKSAPAQAAPAAVSHAPDADTEQKLYALAAKVEEYQQREESMSTAILKAQRLGDELLRDARAKAESIVAEANAKAEEIIGGANSQKQRAEESLTALKGEITTFKTDVVRILNEQIGLLNSLPLEEKKEDKTPGYVWRRTNLEAAGKPAQETKEDLGE